MKPFNKKLMYGSVIIYAILLIWAIVFKWTNYEAVEHSIYTFRHLQLYERYLAIKPWSLTFDIVDIVLNMLLFLPLGLYFVLLLKRKYLIIIFSVVLTLIFEVSQFFTCIGMFNIYDLLGNIMGCVLGYILFLIFNRYVSKFFIDVTNIVILSLLSPVCIYAIIITIINFNSYL
ncbi:MAG: VanZ family protein [Bacilli bacterium]|nr:VanZ family protein [Bacilli bacterium]